MERSNRAYEYRIYPNPQQETFLLKTLGLCRLYWNTNLAQKNDDHSNKLLTYHQLFTKYKPEALEWIKDISVVALNNEYLHITQAFSNFFNSCKKQRKGKFVKPPKFKSKKNTKDSFTIMAPEFRNGKLFVGRKVEPFTGSFDCQFCQGKMKSTTFRRTATGKWFVKILVEKKEQKKTSNGKIIGIDWNCRDAEFLTLSDGTKIKCPRFLREKQKHLNHLQRTMSKRYVRGAEKQSGGYERAKYKVARQHEKVADARKDWLNKLSRQMANDYEFVVVEDINLQVMASGLHHGKVVGDQGFGVFRQMLSYKTNLIKVPAKNTSKTCHVCGYVNLKVKQGTWSWKCPICGEIHDRDINASLNILARGVKSLQNSRSGNYRSQNADGEPSSSMKSESQKPFMEAVNAA
jgi:putative transposase